MNVPPQFKGIFEEPDITDFGDGPGEFPINGSGKKGVIEHARRNDSGPGRRIDTGHTPSEDSPAGGIGLNSPRGDGPSSGPCDLEAECSILGCSLDDPDSWEKVSILTPSHFSDIENYHVFRVMARLHEAGEIVCIDTVAPALDAEFKARGRHCNAFLKLSGLIDAASSALFSNHLASVLEHHARRQLFALSLRLKDGATTADIEHLLADIGSSTKSLVFAAKDHSQRLRRPSSYAIPPDNDPSILLGDRYLNRGDGMILSSTSGMGKSSMSIQMAYHWALGRPAFGIKSNGPLRSLIIQAEDSDGDVAEVCQSIEHVLELNPEERATIDQNIAIVTERVARGLKFVSSLKALIAEFKPDLVWINPLQAFMDGDVKESKDLGFFLREQLNHLNDPPQFGYVVVHHTTKPPSEKADRKWNEVMYDMAGGAEIINWARAIMSLRAGDEPGDFNLVLAKRGARAGVTRRIEDGLNTRHEVVTTIPLRHAKGTIPASDGRKKPLRVIFWEGRPGDKPAAPSRDSSDELSYSDFASVFPKKDSSGLPIAQLIKALSVNRRMTDRQLHPLLKSWVKDGIVESIQDPKGTRYRQAV